MAEGAEAENEFDLGLSEEEIERLAAEQKAQGIGETHTGMHSPEQVALAGAVDQIKKTLEDSVPDVMVKENEDGSYLIGSQSTGYIRARSESGQLQLSIPPSFNKMRDDIERGAKDVYEHDGKAGPHSI